VSTARAPLRSIPTAGRWPVLERIPRRRFRAIRRAGRIVSAAGALVILALAALLVDLDFPWPHVLGLALAGAWIVAVTWASKRVWLRWLRRDFAGEVNAKLDAIRSAAPFN
jgi:hypothetical protein